MFPFVLGYMVGSVFSPLLAGAALTGVALGVYLGESAVGLIDPIHFQGPAIHPRDRGAAIDPRGRPQPGPVYADLYGWEEGEAAFATDCSDCASLVPAPASILPGAPAFDPPPDHWDAPRLAAREVEPELAITDPPGQAGQPEVVFAGYSDDPGKPDEPMDDRGLDQD